MNARALLDELGWTKQEPRSGYDAAIFRVLEQLVDEVESLQAQIRHLGYVQAGGEPE